MDGGLLTSSDLYAGADVGYRCHTVGVQRKPISTYARKDRESALAKVAGKIERYGPVRLKRLKMIIISFI